MRQRYLLPLIPALLLFGSLINGWPYAMLKVPSAKVKKNLHIEKEGDCNGFHISTSKLQRLQQF
jgi:hypothetical protein